MIRPRQFLSRDPAVATTRSPYGYVGGNPLNATDPSGECGLWGSDTCWGDAAGWVNQHVVQPVVKFATTHVFQVCVSGTLPNLAGLGQPYSDSNPAVFGGSVCLPETRATLGSWPARWRHRAGFLRAWGST